MSYDVAVVGAGILGLAHALAAARLGKRQLHARQISARGGELFCEMAGERVYIGGRAVLFSKARIFL